MDLRATIHSENPYSATPWGLISSAGARIRFKNYR